MASLSFEEIGFIEKLLNVLENRELSSDVYLHCGSKKNIKRIMNMGTEFDEKVISVFDSTDIASFVKHFLSSLKEPLISRQCRQCFSVIGNVSDRKRIKKLAHASFLIGKPERKMLYILLNHFNKLSSHFGHDWTISLSRVFTPTLSFSHEELLNEQIFLQNNYMETIPKVLVFLIYNCEKVYRKYESLLAAEENEVAFIFLSKCLKEVEDRGLDTLGIYRVGGLKKNVDSLLSFSEDREKVNKLILTDASEWHIKTITSAIKYYISNLKEPLLTINVANEIISAVDLDSSDQIKNILLTLPDGNQKLLQMILKHLTLVLEKEETTKMTLNNLAIVFGPTIFQNADPEKIEDCNSKVSFLIANYHKIFHELPS